MRMSHNRHSHLMLAQHFTLPFRHSRYSTRPGPSIPDGQSMPVLHLHSMLLHRRLMSITRRRQVLPHMLWPCVRSSGTCIQFHLTFSSIAVLNPVGKMAYFKKNWLEELQDDVLACAERVVHNSSSSYTCSPLTN
jgi:hypothetical protein